MKARVRIRSNVDPLPPDTIRLKLVFAGDDATPQRPYQVVMADGTPLFAHPPRFPFPDGARECLRRGMDRTRMVALYGPGGGLMLAARLGYAGRWTVSENAASGPRLTEWTEPPADLWKRGE
jgi:hypothetical protein